MGQVRTAAAATLLVVEAVLGAVGVTIHYGVTAEYGDITDSAWDAFLSGFSAGVSGMALLVVVAVAVGAASASPKAWMRLSAIAVPPVLVVGMFVVTPAALHHKLEVQYDPAPQCAAGSMGAGPGAREARKSQRAFDSIEHVGYFSGGGATGVAGCDRSFVVLEEVDVLQHYRRTLPEAGWRLVEDDAHHVRAERDGMAVEVAACDHGGVAWAGRDGVPGSAECETSMQVSGDK